MTHEAKSWQTTVTGLAKALVALALAYRFIDAGQADVWTGVFVAAFAVFEVWQGKSARDDGVSSEGRRAPKAFQTKAFLLAAVGLPLALTQVGCQTNAGDFARLQSAPILQNLWDGGIRADAEHGINAYAESGEITETMKEARIERLNQYTDLVHAMNRKGNTHAVH